MVQSNMRPALVAVPRPIKSEIDVSAYYDKKTASILKKYGPGPRVHFHIGYYESPPSLHANPGDLRRQMVASQEAMIRRAALFWDAEVSLSGNVLDVGCGLGGGSLFWAAEYAARVTSVTIAPEHIPLIKSFAKAAGVGSRVQPILADCCRVEGPRRFDGVVAMESACYFPRRQWFKHLATLVKPGGYVCIEDTFLGSSSWKAQFDTYWHTDVAPLEEYVSAARAAGFVLDRAEDVTAFTTPFWPQSAAWSEHMMLSESDEERQRLRRSLAWHQRFREAWDGGGIDVQLLRFRFLG